VASKSDNIQKYEPYTFIPLQVFEGIHLNAYNHQFHKLYVKISLILEIETVSALQFQREAFSDQEIQRALKVVLLLNSFQQRLDDAWKDARWILDNVTLARKDNLEYITIDHIYKFLNKNNINLNDKDDNYEFIIINVDGVQKLSQKCNNQNDKKTKRIYNSLPKSSTRHLSLFDETNSSGYSMIKKLIQFKSKNLILFSK
jgi:hypothetical protein